MNRWLKKRLPNTAECRQWLGVHRWHATDGLPPGTEPRRPARLLRALRRRFDDHRIWHLNRRSVAGAVGTGLLVAWLPVPFQMIVAACFAAVLRVHVPLSVVMVWFTNPLTVAPLGYVAWRVGSMLLHSPAPGIDPQLVGPHTLLRVFHDAWPEILAGCVVLGICSAVLGYLLTLATWRIWTIRRWRGRPGYRGEAA